MKLCLQDMAIMLYRQLALLRECAQGCFKSQQLS